METKEDSFLVRLAIVFYVVIFVFLMIFLRLVFIQVINRNNYLMGLSPQIDTEYNTIKAERGDIFDVNGEPLAVSSTFFQLDVNPYLLSASEKEKLIKFLPQILNTPKTTIQQLMLQKDYVMVNSSLNATQKQKIEELNITNGISLSRTVKRTYPLGNKISTVIGAVGLNGTGLAGLEYSLDSYLSGKNGRVFKDFTSTKPLMPGEVSFSVDPVKGNTVKLTIDANIQSTIQRLLEEKIKEVQAKKGLVIVMNTKTGEILGLANFPSYDPIALTGFSSAIDMAVNWNYEPGSVIKPIVAAAALEAGTLRTDEDFYCSGSVKVKDRVISCWQKHGAEHGLNTIMMNSCDVAFVQTGLKLGKENLFNSFKRFGFGEATGIELPGEEKGILPDFKNIGDVEIANMSFGQGIAVTPLQLISAFQAIANKGVQVKPTIIKEITDASGNVIFQSKTIIKQAVISEDTALKVMDSLKAVVEGGGVPQAKIPGYEVAGKTGTAQKVLPSGGYSNQKLIYSFCGILTVNDPQIAVLIVIDETPTPTYSLNITAPLFKEIGEFLVRYLRISK